MPFESLVHGKSLFYDVACLIPQKSVGAFQCFAKRVKVNFCGRERKKKKRILSCVLCGKSSDILLSWTLITKEEKGKINQLSFCQFLSMTSQSNRQKYTQHENVKSTSSRWRIDKQCDITSKNKRSFFLAKSSFV